KGTAYDIYANAIRKEFDKSSQRLQSGTNVNGSGNGGIGYGKESSETAEENKVEQATVRSSAIRYAKEGLLWFGHHHDYAKLRFAPPYDSLAILALACTPNLLLVVSLAYARQLPRIAGQHLYEELSRRSFRAITT
ncbi:MAG: hypothetical protein IKP71_05835, partial [Candidatus Riflebacteria bacterium]|nr:hypothetical protein [Candidatus Riflebacteria bacterium]